MKKKSSIRWAAMALLSMALVSCQQEPLRVTGGVDCGGCNDPLPGGGTVTDYCGDVVISKFTYQVVDNTYILYQVTLTNVGTGPVKSTPFLPITGSLLAYVSADTNLDDRGGVDPSACGTPLYFTLLPGQSVPYSFRCYNPSLLSKGTYLIMHANLKPETNDCKLYNNIAVIPI
jgi:hypothetical protein